VWFVCEADRDEILEELVEPLNDTTDSHRRRESIGPVNVADTSNGLSTKLFQ
jgi:hypothetical protein